ncbi:MAG: Lrp/AsnC family transcriptional regulator [Nannocystaceae bacterium]|jgi:Lrp/AsnC family leucine-responsive transcriptional regulator
MTDPAATAAEPVVLDAVDREVLRLLQHNGRMTNAALAEAVGLTPTPMLARIKKLEQRGVITKYVAIADAAALDRATTAFVSVKLAAHRLATHEAFLAAVTKLPEVLECHHIAGEDDFLLKVVVRDIREYEHFLLHRLSRISGIDRVQTTFVLSTAKNETAIPIE